jgi:hypothetical protein
VARNLVPFCQCTLPMYHFVCLMAKDARPECDDYGYGDGRDAGAVDSRTTSIRTPNSPSSSSRRDRPRRRGSVTRYSLETAEAAAVQNEQEEHAKVVRQFRSSSGTTIDSMAVPLKRRDDDAEIKGHRSRCGSEEEDRNNKSEESLNDSEDHGKKAKKSSMGRFRIGRNRSASSNNHTQAPFSQSKNYM